MSTARAAALQVLLAVEARHTTLAAAVDRARRDVADPRDRALLLELTAGTLRWQGAIDARIARQSRRPVADLDASVRALLRLGVYQLDHLTRVPARAVVHDAVDLAREAAHEGAAGFVNAVRRGLARGGAADALPDDPGTSAPRDRQLDYLATSLSHPRWLVARWLDRYGYEATRAWCRFNLEPPDVTIRAAQAEDPDALIADLVGAGIEATPGRFGRRAIRLPPGGLGRVPEAWRPRFRVQDEASQLVAEATGVQPGWRTLDLCAAPGGKTLVLAEAAGPSGRVVACDHRPARIAQLRRTLADAGLAVPIVRLDARRPLPFGATFDCVFVDVPCSGLGTIRRDPDVKWSRHEDDLAGLASAQGLMLDEAAAAVAPGGRLVYATCSSEPEENALVVAAFLGRHGTFARQTVEAPGDGPDAAALVDATGCLVTRPDRDGLDAFFGAVLVRGQAT
ncbi:MAG: transcription antitermination factor NusB [Vicinamibacterales bacterium]